MFEIIDLINVMSRLPSIGKKSASRLAYYFIKNKDFSNDFIKILDNVIKNIKPCEICGKFTTNNHCEICSDLTRNKTILCIVEDQKDMQAIEETGVFQGYYHILSGAINPLEGINPDKLRIKELNKRLQTSSFKEIFIATNPTVEGEATFLYLQNIILDSFKEIKISRIATGIPMGGSLEYADRYTLSKAIQQKQYL